MHKTFLNNIYFHSVFLFRCDICKLMLNPKDKTAQTKNSNLPSDVHFLRFNPPHLSCILRFLKDYLAHIIDESELSNHPELVCALFGNIEDIYEFNRWGDSGLNILRCMREVAVTELLLLLFTASSCRTSRCVTTIPSPLPGVSSRRSVKDETSGRKRICRCEKILHLMSGLFQSEDFDIYTQYCTNYPK